MTAPEKQTTGTREKVMNFRASVSLVDVEDSISQSKRYRMGQTSWSRLISVNALVKRNLSFRTFPNGFDTGRNPRNAEMIVSSLTLPLATV